MQGARVVTSTGRFQIPARHGLDARQLLALVEAIHRFDRLLDAPLRTWTDGPVRGVDLFGLLRFTACERSRSLGIAARLVDGEWAPVEQPQAMSIAPPLRETWRMAWLLDRLGLDWRAPVLNEADRQRRALDNDPDAWDVCEANHEGPGETQFIALLRRQLRTDPRFRALDSGVARALLGDELLALAWRAGGFDLMGDVAVRRLQQVWREHERYAEIARRAPKLLPLAGFALKELDASAPASEVLEQLRLAIRTRGEGDSLGDRCWQWLLRHGLRPLAPIFRDRPNLLDLDGICVMLEGIADAGWPDRLTPRFMRHWHGLNTPYGARAWESVRPRYWNLVRPAELRELVAAQG